MRHATTYAVLFVTYVVVTMAIAMVWHLVLFREAYQGFGLRSDPIIAFGLLATLIQAGVWAYLYPRFRRDAAPALEGLQYGLLMGLFLGSYGVLAEAAKFNVLNVPAWLLYEGAFFLVQFTVLGVLTGLIAGARGG